MIFCARRISFSRCASWRRSFLASSCCHTSARSADGSGAAVPLSSHTSWMNTGSGFASSSKFSTSTSSRSCPKANKVDNQVNNNVNNKVDNQVNKQ